MDDEHNLNERIAPWRATTSLTSEQSSLSAPQPMPVEITKLPGSAEHAATLQKLCLSIREVKIDSLGGRGRDEVVTRS